tara:strand:- start:137 stop:913 length:777 start_codon:yes stop_codon:yes gene_type:complete
MAIDTLGANAIANDAVTAAKIPDGAVTTAKVADGFITTAKLADDAVTTAKIGAGAITNTEVNASAAITQSKLAAIASGNLPTGTVLQVAHYINNSGSTYAATSSSGHDILDKTVTTKGANSTFLVHWSICHGVGGEENNMDSHDMLFFALRTASSTHAYVGGNAGLTRDTAGAPSDQKIYLTDVPFSSERGRTPAYGNNLDVYHRSGSFIDSPSLSAGVTNQYRIRMYNQSLMYLNRGRGSAANAGGVSSLVIMEIGA